MAAPKKLKGVFGGIFLIVLGLIFLFNSYGLTNIDVGKLWPLVLIIPGILILSKNF